MKKFLKISLGAVAALIVVFLVLSLIAPKDTHVERSVVISASKSQIWPWVASLEKQHEWSPWADKDPNMVTKYTGQDGTVGSVYRWEGNDEVGIGEQEIKSLDPMNKAVMELRLYEPWESVSEAYVELNEEGSGTKVTWGFNGTSPWPTNTFNLFLDMDKMLGGDFQAGLDKLKNKVEG